MIRDGSTDVTRAADALATRLPDPLKPLAALAYNYWWSWARGGERLFEAIDPHTWANVDHNPVRFLMQVPATALAEAATDEALAQRAAEARAALAEYLAREPDTAAATPESPVAFICTEFAVHRSLPIYAGGLGALAGDILKEASDRRLPMVGVGLLYKQGYFHQRVDPSGWQHEYWTEVDTRTLPGALVAGADGLPLKVEIEIRRTPIVFQIWRVDVGAVPLFLLDADRPENGPVQRWITSRLYIGDRRFRLAQYALLGLGGIRALHAMGIDPGIIHLNEGHAALAPLELVRRAVAEGTPFQEALQQARARTVFTTHTPVPAGNEAYSAAEALDVFGDLPAQLGVDAKDLLALGRAHAEDIDEPFGMTQLGLRVSATANGVSRKHGEVARGMWHHLYPNRPIVEVPIGHVTNGVHVPTWIAPRMRALLDKYLGDGWESRASDPATWAGVDAIPDEELWAVRSSLRGQLVGYLRARAAGDRLSRGEPLEYVDAALRAFDPGVLTVGFARRVATYKRLYLLTYDPGRALPLLQGATSIQVAIAGKPHPADEEAKRIIQRLFEMKWAANVPERVAFLEDYDLGIATHLVRGCDLWVNLPRPPLEASGTSGMKAALNGALNLSVLDGWWDEAYDGSNGWGISGHPLTDWHAQDAQDAGALYDLLEREVIPLFYERDESGIPRGWVRMVKASLRTNGPQYSAARMMDDYASTAYRTATAVR